MRGGGVASGRPWNAESCRCAHGQVDSRAMCGSGPAGLCKGRAGCFRKSWHQPPGMQHAGHGSILTKQGKLCAAPLRANACVIYGPSGRQSLRVGWAFPPNL